MIVIIGNGISGVTAARNIRKRSDAPITIVSAESKYFFSRTALMYVYMGHMRFEHTQPYEPHFWKDNNIELIHDFVEEVQGDQKTLLLQKGGELRYDKLIIASGSKPNKFGWKGQEADGVRGLYSKQDLEYIEERSDRIKKAVVVGGGLIGIELAEMFLSRNIEVHFLVREKFFWNSVLPQKDSAFIMEHFTQHHGLHMNYGTELKEIVTNKENQVVGIITENGKQLDCDFVGLTVGVSPNIDFLKSSAIEINKGILVNDLLETSVKDIYAIGDCAELRTPQPNRRSIEQVWYTGKFMGETIAKTITGEETPYNPGHWFNSAKFFDIEYQTYGVVSNELGENESEFIYRHHSENVLLHFIFDKTSRRFIGVNTFGLRLRHPLFNQWLIDNASIDEVLENLSSANFDPEFYKRYESEILEQFNTQFNTTLKSQKKKWWQQLMKA